MELDIVELFGTPPPFAVVMLGLFAVGILARIVMRHRNPGSDRVKLDL